MNSKKYSIVVLLLCSISVGWFAFEFFSQQNPSIDVINPSASISVKDTFTEYINKNSIANVYMQPSSPPLAKTSIESGNKKNKTEVMAWVYPGEPSCNARNEYANREMIDVLKSEYFTVTDGGKLLFLSGKEAGCNGYSPENIADMKKHSRAQYVTISSSYAKNMDLFLQKSLSGDDDTVQTLVDFVVKNDMTGIELDFEDFGGWTGDIYPRYKDFVSVLGNALHAKGKKLMIDGPAIANQEESGWFPWKYEEISSLPVDQVVIMLYDYQFDHGGGVPIAPTAWMKDVILWTKGKIADSAKIVVGIPSYGYKSAVGKNQIVILTHEQLMKEKGFETAARDADSGEMTWRRGDAIYFYQDSESMRIKRKIVEDLGITSVSVWHLGGNPWFEK